MKINEASWIEIRKIIESSLVDDTNITDVILNCKVREASKSKNILTFNAIIK